MASIEVGNVIPGIQGLVQFKPEFAEPVNSLVKTLMTSNNSTLTLVEREFIFTAASWICGGKFCAGLFAALTRSHLDDPAILDKVRKGGPCMISTTHPKLHELLHLAATVVGNSGDNLNAAMTEAVELARKAGATDEEIHDTALIASTACMVNRYIDSVGNALPLNKDFFADLAKTFYV